MGVSETPQLPEHPPPRPHRPSPARSSGPDARGRAHSLADGAQLNSSEHTHACVCECVQMRACLHKCAGEPMCPGWGEGPQWPRLCTCRPASVWLSAEDTCVHVHARPGPAPAARAASFPLAQLQTREGGAGRAGLDLAPQRGGQAKVGGWGQASEPAGGRGGLWSAPRASCPASGRDFGRKVGPIRKALPGEVGLPEAESASPGVHAKPLPLPPPGGSSTAAVPGWPQRQG